MAWLDWVALCGYFLVMLLIGVWSHKRISGVSDYFTGGGRMPWWLSGISHHMSGYSAAVFVAYAAVAYSYGITVYFWAFVPLALATGVGAFLFAPRWNRLRARFNVVSPLEYLAKRYNIPTQQALAWSGALLKVFDVAAKWASVAILLNVFTGMSMTTGILITGVVTLLYCTVGGLWADALTDFGQFVIQGVAALSMLIAVIVKLNGHGGLGGMWDKLPEGHTHPLVGPYTAGFLTAYIVIKLFEYNGGMWNLAQRYMATENARGARRSALLSAALYLIWPAVLLFPSVAAGVLMPHVADPQQVYALMAKQYLPMGLIGLTLAGMFSHTMAMASSDANAISAVITRDIMPVVSRRARSMSAEAGLLAARVCTVAFVSISMIVAIQADHFGGVLGIIVKLVGAVMGPISIPMLLGLLPAFRRCGPIAALASWALGLGAYFLLTYGIEPANQTWLVATPLVTSLIVYMGVGLVKPEPSGEADAIVAAIGSDGPQGAATEAPVPVAAD
ncbi:sodium:solute symporter family protein [Streptomyces sp. NBC_00154]|uniref:sodium:solute symporter family protein n=1 Tax=Streptomyces sp. NBC_00154 TaxID=2975670 RepID=UPI002252EA9D|nr:sodium:solute symporter family protein [Streptomyces sp. NBC_00154]MCX5316069.1 Na+:solute symporter [Streptomyces sp. NBC_00154]